MNLKKSKTYVYIDVSNIRYACSWSLGFQLDFVKLYAYLKKKYPELQDVRYYEGIARNDKKRKKHFEFLQNEVGYTICSLERKSYVTPAKYGNFQCRKCGFLNKVKLLSKVVKMKSNVDVYLATDMVAKAATIKEPIHIILLACDGDYVEAIKTVFEMNPEVFVTILATPLTKVNNRLSRRLVKLAREFGMDKIALTNIDVIKNFVSLEE